MPLYPSQILNNVAGVGPPGTSNDSTQGYTIGSGWLDTTTQVLWTCESATASAAVWTQDNLFPGFRTGINYPTFRGAHANANAIPAISTIYIYPFIILNKVTITSLTIRLVSGSAGVGSHLKMGIWGHKFSSGTGQYLPNGAPLAAINTAQDSSGTTGVNVSAAVSATLNRGIYWAGSKCDGTPPTALSVSSAGHDVQYLLGQSALNSLAIVAISTPDTFSNNLPTFTGSETWTDVTSQGVPIVHFGT